MKIKKIQSQPLRYLWVWLAVSIAVCLMVFLVDQFNPDWIGYELIYLSGGSWLVDQGRDPLFVSLMSIAATILGPDGYPLFRWILAAAFAFFILLLMSGKVIPYGFQLYPSLGVLIAALPLLVPRITVQIREGLAMMFLVTAVGVLLRMEAKLAVAKQEHGAAKKIALAIVLFAFGFGIHAGTIVLFISFFLAFFIKQRTTDYRRRENFFINIFTIFFITFSIFSTIFISTTSWGVGVILNIFGWLVDGNNSMSIEKWFYWIFYGCGIFGLRALTIELAAGTSLGAITRTFALILAKAWLPAFYFSALTLLIFGAPPIAVSALSRTLNMIVAFLFLLNAFRGRTRIWHSLFALFVLIDQARIIGESVQNTLEKLV